MSPFYRNLGRGENMGHEREIYGDRQFDFTADAPTECFVRRRCVLCLISARMSV